MTTFKSAASSLLIRFVHIFFGRGIIHGLSLGLDTYFWIVLDRLNLRPSIIDCHGSPMQVPVDGSCLGPAYERGTTWLFSRLVKRGMVVVDVGAHAGYFTILAARIVGPNGKVYAFEPDPRNYSLLRANVRRNQLTNVEALPLALSNRDGDSRLFIGDRTGDSSLKRVARNARSVVVRTASLDRFFEEPDRRFDVVKIDIEGGEVDALDGMERVIGENHDLVLFVECNPTALKAAGDSPESLHARLRELGFSCWMIDENQLGKLIPPDAQSLGRLRGTINLLCARTKPI